MILGCGGVGRGVPLYVGGRIGRMVGGGGVGVVVIVEERGVMV